MPEFVMHNLWPTPLLEDTIDVKSEWIDFAEKVEYERMASGNGFFTTNKNILNELPDLKSEIEKKCKLYTKNVLRVSDNANFYLQNSWIVKHLPNDGAQIHYHGGSLISGVYYLKTPENSGDIVFVKSHRHINTFDPAIRLDYDEETHINATEYGVKSKAGKIILFPAHVDHSVQKNKSKEDRYSLAFNFFVRGKFGSEEYQLEIK